MTAAREVRVFPHFYHHSLPRFSGVGFDHCLPCPINTYFYSGQGCLFCPDGSASYSYAVTASLSACEPCADAEICSFNRWSVEASSASSAAVYDFSKDSVAAFKAFQNLLTNPMVPMLKPGFWGEVSFTAGERWQTARPGGNNSTSSGSRSLLSEDSASFAEFVGTGTVWLIRIGSVIQTGFTPVSDQCVSDQCLMSRRICGVHVIMSCQICGVMSDA